MTGRILEAADRARLVQLEAVVERGLQTFLEVGEALREIRERHLYRATHETFAAYCRDRFGFSDSRGRQLIAAVETVTAVTARGLPAPATEREARELAQRIRAGEHLYRRGAGGSDPEWYTPAEYVDAARRVLGAIDLDPASCAQANETVRAAAYFSKETDGLEQLWHGRIWLNPPYLGQAGAFVAKLLAEREAGRVEAGILLLNALTIDSQWFSPLWGSPALCFTDHRIRFERPGGAPAETNAISVFVYLGVTPGRFAREFERFGRVLRPWPTEAVSGIAAPEPDAEREAA